MVVFFVSLVGIASLFGMKSWEQARERTIAPAWRVRADARALEFKAWLGRARGEIQKLPPLLLYLSRVAVHEVALGIAASARFLERQAHRLADMVSHKHRFERRESRSEFLKQITEHKNDRSE